MSGKNNKWIWGASGADNRLVAGLVLGVFLAAWLGGCLAEAGQADAVSGRLVNGLRVLSVAELAESPNMAVYRGDYIQFEFSVELSGEKGARFSVPALDIEADLLPGFDQPPYFKMKQVGTYDYTLGEIAGTLRVMEYEGAHYQALTAQQARDIMAAFEPLILDVRTPAEFKAVRIEGARLLPVQVLEQNLSVLSDYKEEPILIYCATGNRSTVAAKILIDNGFKRIFNLKKGIKDWAGQGFPVVR